ncbi:hypothetical protein AMTRI_Chr09g19540 [Amborella trichopoda]
MRDKASGSKVYWIFIISDYTVYFDQNIFNHGAERKKSFGNRELCMRYPLKFMILDKVPLLFIYLFMGVGGWGVGEERRQH